MNWAFDAERFDVLSAERDEARVLSDVEILAAVDAPIGSAPLDAIAKPGERICIVVPDATRASGSARVVPLLLSKLGKMGVADRDIEVLVGGGIHRRPTSDEFLDIVSTEVASRVAVRHHNASDAQSHVLLGTTSRGTPVEVNRRLVEANRVILVGAIGFHYFAGFSGGRKAFLPGCASERAIRANHLLAFDGATLSRAAGVGSGLLDGNPLNEDLEEAAALFGPTFLVNTVIGGSRDVVALYTGNWLGAHRKGCADYLDSHSVAVSERRRVVVVSCGGAPRDVNMIQAHKALEHARLVAEEGADIVLLAECGEGLGRDDFLDWFVAGGSNATAKLLVRNYKVNGQTAWALRWKAERYRVRMVSALDADAVRLMGMIPHETLESALAAVADDRGYIIPNGVGTLPVFGGAIA